MSNNFGVMIEGLVAILLMLTVSYCMLLNRRLKLLKADEMALRATISELITATEIAERAIAGLKITVHECDIGLGERLNRAEAVSADLDRKLTVGKDVLNRLSQIAAAARPAHEPVPPPVNEAKSVAVAAQAFADRLRTKVHGLAA
jgi:Domain of unknown function (DUF6468)